MAIIPGQTELTRPYWQEARRGRLVTQHCPACDRSWHPPLPLCPYCHRPGLDWRPVAGTGTVYSYTVVRHATHAALADRIPYVVAIVELTEGMRIVAGIRGCPAGDVRVGLPVRVIFEDVTEQVTLPQFEPVSGEHSAGPPVTGT